MKNQHRQILSRLALTLVGLQLLLMLVSWLWSAAFPESGVRSLLSGEGMRWFFGRFTYVLATPQLVWLVVSAMAYGVLMRSGLLQRHSSYRERRALMMSVILLFIIIVVMLLLVALPHAVLISAVGGLWPSPFSESIVPVVAFSVLLIAAMYGMIAGNYEGVADVYDAVLEGLRRCAPLFLFYVLFTQIYESLRFVFPQNPYF